MDLFKILKNNEIDSTEIDILKKYKSRDGFIIIENNELKEMKNYFNQFSIYENVIPIMTDNNSNYLCIYVKGIMKGMICHLSHDGIDLSPKFKNISNLIKAIDNYPDVYDFYEFDENILDFPTKSNSTNFHESNNIIEKLFIEFKKESDDEKRQQFAFSIMALTGINEIEKNIYGFLEDEDMYIQERAIELLGFFEYVPAREKLEKLVNTAMPNGQTAAKIALKKLRQSNGKTRSD